MITLKKRITKENNIIPILLFLFSVIFLAFYRLREYPAFWFDEGYNSLVVQSLYHHGVYGTVFYDSTMWFNIYISTGPLLIIPATIFHLFGIEIILAVRLSAILYWLGFVSLFFYRTYYISRNLLFTIIISIVLVITTFVAGRQFLGEYSTLFFLLASILMLEKKNNRHIVLSAILFGIAINTKLIMIIATPVFLIFIFINENKPSFSSLKELNRTLISKLVLFLIIASVPQILWYITQIIILGPNNFFELFLNSVSYYSRLHGLVFLTQAVIIEKLTNLPLMIRTVLLYILLLIIALVGTKKITNITIFSSILFIIFTLDFMLLDVGWVRHYNFIGLFCIFLQLSDLINIENVNENYTNRRGLLVLPLITFSLLLYISIFVFYSKSLIDVSLLLCSFLFFILIILLIVIQFKIKIPLKRKSEISPLNLLILGFILSQLIILSLGTTTDFLFSSVEQSEDQKSLVNAIYANIPINSYIFTLEHEINAILYEDFKLIMSINNAEELLQSNNLSAIIVGNTLRIQYLGFIQKIEMNSTLLDYGGITYSIFVFD